MTSAATEVSSVGYTWVPIPPPRPPLAPRTIHDAILTATCAARRI